LEYLAGASGTLVLFLALDGRGWLKPEVYGDRRCNWRKEKTREGRRRRISEKEGYHSIPEEQGHEWQTGRGSPFAV